MTVKISKPELNIREELSDLKKPSGVAGEAMLRAETPQEQFTLIGAGRRNILMNGDMKIWQRGTPIPTTEYAADRWMVWSTNAGVANRGVTCTQQTGGPTELGKNSKYLQASLENDTGIEKLAWGQKIEASNLTNIPSGQRMTLSFWIKKEQNLPTDNTLDIQILYPGSVDGWAAGYLFRDQETVDQTINTGMTFNSLSTEWTKYSYTFIPRDLALDRGFAVYWHVGNTNFGSSSTAALFSFTGVQLEVGSVATPFEYRSYGEELASCQRYCYVYGQKEGTNNEAHIGTGNAYNSAGYNVTVTFPVELRYNPTFAASPSSGNVLQFYMGYTGQYASASDIQSTTDFSGTALRMYVTGFTGLNPGEAAWVHTVNNAYIIFDAEL